jgi:5-methyltetrahydrofolate--homocysteine methyltransferase
MGTVLQHKGLPAGGQPELLNLTEPGLIEDVHRAYIRAGSRVVYTNTFGANRLKLERAGHEPAEIIPAAVAAAKRAAAGTDAAVALDVGPLGALLEPLGSLSFEWAYGLFREMTEAGEAAGADLIVIETITDLCEARAALLAAKESTRLPVFVTMSFEESGRTFTGCTAASMARTLEGLGADAVGLNCSLGPDKLAPLIREVCENTTLPVIAKPNAGLPDPLSGATTWARRSSPRPCWRAWTRARPYWAAAAAPRRTISAISRRRWPASARRRGISEAGPSSARPPCRCRYAACAS